MSNAKCVFQLEYYSIGFCVHLVRSVNYGITKCTCIYPYTYSRNPRYLQNVFNPLPHPYLSIPLDIGCI